MSVQTPTGTTNEASPAPPAHRHRQALLLSLLALLLLLLFDWNWFKGPVQRQVELLTGRSFRIEGNLDVDLHPFRPTIRAGDIVLGNADWATEPDMLRAVQVEIDWNPWALFVGEVSLPRVALAEPRLLLERDDGTRVNWRFRDEDGPDPMPTSFPDIGELIVDGGQLRLIEPGRRTELGVTVQSLEDAGQEGPAPLALAGTGRYRGNAFTLDGRIDSPLHLAETGKPYAIELTARAGSTHVRAAGALESPLQLQDFDLDFDIAGQDLAHLYPLLGIAAPRSAPYALNGRLGRSGTVWTYRGMSGRVGESDLAGEVSVDNGQVRPLLGADLVSKRLDFGDLAGFVGGTPKPGKDDGPAPGGRLFPDVPYDLSKLRAMDARVRLRARRVDSAALPIEAMDATLVLVDGELHLDPLVFAVAQGEIRSRIHLDARQDPIAGEIDVTAKGLELPRLFPEAAPDSRGRVGGRVQVAGRGNSVAALMANASGEIGLGMGKGQVSNLTLELAGLDIFEALRFMLGKDKVVPVRCGFADFAVKDGVMQARSLVFDTTDTLLLGEGRIDLRDESLDLRLLPRPKDRSPLSLRSPLRVGGTIMDPSIRPEGGPLVLRGLLAAALYAVAPPVALLALVETGPGEDADCAARTAPKP